MRDAEALVRHGRNRLLLLVDTGRGDRGVVAEREAFPLGNVARRDSHRDAAVRLQLGRQIMQLPI